VSSASNVKTSLALKIRHERKDSLLTNTIKKTQELLSLKKYRREVKISDISLQDKKDH